MPPEVFHTEFYLVFMIFDWDLPYKTIQFLAVDVILPQWVGYCCHVVCLDGDFFSLDLILNFMVSFLDCCEFE